MGKSFKEEALGLVGIGFLYVVLCHIGFMRWSWTLVMVVSAFAAVVYYGWLTQEHPDRADRIRERCKDHARRASPHVIGAAKWGTTRLGQVTHLSSESTLSDSLPAMVDTARAVQEDRAANPRSVPQGTKAYAAYFEGVVEPLGVVENYIFDEATGNKIWQVALPVPWTADDFATKFKQMFVSAASTSWDAVHINPFLRADGHLDESRMQLVIQNQAARKPIESGIWPLLEEHIGSLSVKAGIPVGVKANGQEWCLELINNHTFAAGLTRWGKSGLLRNIVGGVSLMNDASLWVIDPKGVDYSIWEGVMDRYASDASEYEEFLLAALGEMQRRLTLLKEMKRTKWNATTEHPHLVILIDEAASVPSDIQTSLLVPLIEKGAGAGITIVAATTRFTGDRINTTFRSQFNTVIGFKTKDDKELSIILGPGLKAHGVMSNRIKRRGECWIDEGETFAFARTYFIEDEDVLPYAERIAVERGRQNPVEVTAPETEPGIDREPEPGIETPDALTSAIGDRQDTPESAVNEPPELWTLPGRAPAIWRLLAAAASAERPMSKAEVARRIGIEERGKEFDKGALTADFAALESGCWMRPTHGPNGQLRGFVATVPDGIEYDA